jgi:GAF domain-containing protein
MTVGWDDAFRASFDDLTALLVAEEPLQTVLQRVVDLACTAIPGCDFASVTLMKDGVPETIVCTDPIALQIDRAQYEHDSGPCLSAFRRRMVESVPSMRDDDRWKPFREAALSQDVHSSFSLPLAAGETKVGALNLYGQQDHGFEAVAPAAALLFASQAAAAVWNARTHEQTRDLLRSLHLALETREMIGMAKGIIMANERLRPDQAFDTLRTASQHRNVKLREIADQVVATGETPTP